MDWLALVNRLKVESGRSGGVIADVTLATGDDARLVNWIADAWLEIQRRPHGWTFMRAEVSGELAAGTASYAAEDLEFWTIGFTAGSTEYVAGDTLTQGAVSAIVKKVAVTTGDWGTSDAAGFMVITPVAGVFAAGAALGDGACDLDGPATSPGPFDRWVPPTIEAYAPVLEDGNGEQWRPRHMAWDRFRATTRQEFADDRCWPVAYWSISPDERLHFGPVPDDAYSVTASYYTTPVPFAVNADEPTFGSQYHMILVWRALMELASFDSAPEVYARAQMNFSNLDREMKLRYGPPANYGLSYFDE